MSESAPADAPGAPAAPTGGAADGQRPAPKKLSRQSPELAQVLLTAVANSEYITAWASSSRNNHGTGAALDEIIASVKEDGYDLPEKNTVRKYLTGEAPTKRTFTSYQDYIKSKGFLAVIENGENHKQRIYASMLGSSSLPLRLVFSTPALRIFPLSLVMVVTISSLVMVVTIFPLSLVMVVTIFPLSLVMVVTIFPLSLVMVVTISFLMAVTISFLLVMVVSC